MIARVLILVVIAAAVAWSPAWLEAMAAALFGANDFQRELPFSPYWIATPAALGILWSLYYELRYDAAAGLASSGAAAPGLENNVWLRLEADFQAALQAGSDLEASWSRESPRGSQAVEAWSIRSLGDDNAALERFADLSRTAGRMLTDRPGYKPKLEPATAERPEQERWLYLLRDRGINSETHTPTPITDDKGALIGHAHSGTIERLIEASLKLCVQLSLEDDLNGDLNRLGEAVSERLMTIGS